MAILTRLTRLFRADVHAVLDRLEEPDVLLRQAIREMEDALTRKAQQLKARELDRRQAEQRLSAIEASQHDLATQLDLCFDAQNEALARTLLRRKLEGERMGAHLQGRIAALQGEIAACGSQLDEERRQLEAMRQKAEAFENDLGPTTCREAGTWRGTDFTVSDADVELAWLREQQRRRA
jgi:phage shock protein A